MSKSSARHANIGKDNKNIRAKILAKKQKNLDANLAKMQANLDYIRDHGLQRIGTEAPSTTVRRHQRLLEQRARTAPIHEVAGATRLQQIEEATS